MCLCLTCMTFCCHFPVAKRELQVRVWQALGPELATINVDRLIIRNGVLVSKPAGGKMGNPSGRWSDISWQAVCPQTHLTSRMTCLVPHLPRFYQRCGCNSPSSSSSSSFSSPASSPPSSPSLPCLFLFQLRMLWAVARPGSHCKRRGVLGMWKRDQRIQRGHFTAAMRHLISRCGARPLGPGPHRGRL